MEHLKEVKELLGDVNMDELLAVLSRIEKVRKLQGEDIALRALAKAIRRVGEDSEFFGVGENGATLPLAGNECGIHTQFTSLVAKIRNRQNEEKNA
jgi:hypothetical protein